MPSRPASEAVAALLGRHYVAGRFEADELSERLDAAFGAAPQDALAGLPALPSVAPRRRRWRRGHGEADVADPSWMPTKERFIDPSTQRVMRVWVDPADHSRHYVAETS
ncbi:MAG TPA: DUF1707 domain-containing protein [Solirubrobacter sp.]|nr:DUF1707 domain-containing protein [Solirubrobacter sp.]